MGDVMDTTRRNKRISDWQRDNKDRIIILADKADGQQIRQAAADAGKTITQYIVDAVKDKMQTKPLD